MEEGNWFVELAEEVTPGGPGRENGGRQAGRLASVTLALPKGKLGEDAVALARAAGLPVEGLATEDRRLVFDFPAAGVRYIICRSTDVPVYVEFGAADLGIAGKDTIVESGSDVFELVDLKFGFCRFVVAVPAETLAGAIVDIVSTGRTLRENGLVEVEEVFAATARLIANRVSYRLKYDRLRQVVESFRQQVERPEGLEREGDGGA